MQWTSNISMLGNQCRTRVVGRIAGCYDVALSNERLKQIVDEGDDDTRKPKQERAVDRRLECAELQVADSGHHGEKLEPYNPQWRNFATQLDDDNGVNDHPNAP